MSDAIIGLTILAVGKSFSDLSKINISMAAAFALIMGSSTCFDVPMVNFFLGIGISDSYVILQVRVDLCTLYG